MTKNNKTLAPYTVADINNGISTLYTLINIPSRGKSYTTRRTTFSTCAYYKVDRDIIKQCAAWTSNHILDFYVNENPLSNSENIRLINTELVSNLLHSTTQNW